MRSNWVAAGLWAGCWLISLLCPVAITGSPQDSQTSTGWAILIMGWLGPLALQFGWFANPAFLLALMAIVTVPRRSMMLAAAAVVAIFTVDALTWRSMVADIEVPIRSFGVGYYLWFAAMLGASGTLVWQVIQGRPATPVRPA